MKKYRRLVLAIPAFVFITAFQNCSVYQSSGRKYVENGDAKRVDDADPSGKPAAACEPYLNEAAASEAMGVFSTTKMVLEPSTQTASCVVSANEQSSSPSLDIAVCSISADNLQLLQNPPDQTMVLDPYGPLSRGSLGFSRKLPNGNTQFVFVGSSDSAMEAVACHFEFDTEADYQSHADSALEKSARLVHQIYRTLR